MHEDCISSNLKLIIYPVPQPVSVCNEGLRAHTHPSKAVAWHVNNVQLPANLMPILQSAAFQMLLSTAEQKSQVRLLQSRQFI